MDPVVFGVEAGENIPGTKGGKRLNCDIIKKKGEHTNQMLPLLKTEQTPPNAPPTKKTKQNRGQ